MDNTCVVPRDTPSFLVQEISFFFSVDANIHYINYVYKIYT